jgi:hypothetical protein
MARASVPWSALIFAAVNGAAADLGQTFHTARVVRAGRWFLGASTEWPAVEPADLEIGDVDSLDEKYPGAADDLRAFQ